MSEKNHPSNEHPCIVWFRQDLRLEDQPALMAAIQRGQPVIPLFIWSPEEDGEWRPGAASRWWLHQSLARLDEQLRSFNSKLIVRHGDTLRELLAVIDETGAAAVYWTRRYEPAAIHRDSQVKAELRRRNVDAQSFNGQLLFEPWEVQTKDGRPYQVFTAFWKTCLAAKVPDEPQPTPHEIPLPSHWPASLHLDDLRLKPTIRWDAGLQAAWQPGADFASHRLNEFLRSTIVDYHTARDQPAEFGTARLSPHLHYGELSPRTVWHRTRRFLSARTSNRNVEGAETFLKELGWREFAHHLLFHFPRTTNEPLRPEFVRFPWIVDAKGLRAWQRGETGFPIVDAGMRELWATGWMHNRVRMIVASFLVKDLLVPWQDGAAWFWNTLVDADLASNTLGWQWTAGCGADAAPFFRVFNPALQSQKFDANGEYLRRWLPELKSLSARSIHAPTEAPASELAAAGVKLGQTYPHPIVDHNVARQRALDALNQMTGKSKRTRK